VVSDALTSQVDLFATLAAAAGCPLPPGSAPDSYNLLPVWRDGAPSPRRTLVHNTYKDVYALRHDHWLLVAAPSGTHTKVPEWFTQAERLPPPHGLPGELFDLSQDPGQRQNVYADHPGVVADLTAKLNETRARGQVR
jgi:arylsulfatase A